MRGFFISSLVLTLFFAPSFVHASEGYAATVQSAGANVLTPTNALGAPDGAYADFRDLNATLTLDMGTDTTGNLTFTVYLMQFGAGCRVTYRDAAGDVVGTDGGSFGLSATTFTATNTTGVPYRYVEITSVNSFQWRLDAVSGEQASVPTTDDTATEVTPGDEPTIPTASFAAGSLLKADNGSAVYILGSDGMRHAFPTETVFTTWGLSFADVMTVDDAILAAYTLGRNVTIRPGTYLVKLQTNPKVFAVEPGGVLRWVSSESVALQLYGSDWASRVVDVSDAFWSNYSIGSDIATAVHPDGVVLTSGGVRYYVSDAAKAVLDADTSATLRLSKDFDISGVNATILGQYMESTLALLAEGVQWPY